MVAEYQKYGTAWQRAKCRNASRMDTARIFGSIQVASCMCTIKFIPSWRVDSWWKASQVAIKCRLVSQSVSPFLGKPY